MERLRVGLKKLYPSEKKNSAIRRILFLIFLIAINSSRVIAASISQSNTEKRAHDFLCNVDLCVSTPVTIVPTDQLAYLGYYEPQSKRIYIDSKLDPIEEQLTLVHEYVHVYRKEHNSNEARWLEEGLAKLWEYKYSNVWPQSYNSRFIKNPFVVLSEDEAFYKKNGTGYISSFFLTIYLYKHFGGDSLIQKLMNSNSSGWDNILTSIHELIDSGEVQIPHELITKQKILRHFAVALWMNDPYSAQYSLFFIDENFEPLYKFSTYSDVKFAKNLPGADSAIFYKSHFDRNFKTFENYVISNYQPFEISKATPDSTGNVFIHLGIF